MYMKLPNIYIKNKRQF